MLSFLKWRRGGVCAVDKAEQAQTDQLFPAESLVSGILSKFWVVSDYYFIG